MEVADIQNIITYPKLDEYHYYSNVFKVDSTARQYFDRNDKPKLNRSLRELHNLKNTNSKISNSIDNSNAGSRCMEELVDFNSGNSSLKSMSSILKIFETKTYKDKKNNIKLHTLKPSLISSSKTTFPQRFHTDYKNSQYQFLDSNSDNIPYIVFFGIDENTIIYIWDKETEQIIEHEVEVGAVLILALNVVHAGAAYKLAEGKLHRRVQMYMDTDDIIHDYINPNEWLALPIQNQPLRLVLENGMFSSEEFRMCVNKRLLQTIYNLDKDKIRNALVNDEKNKNSRKRSRIINLNWNQMSV